MANESDRVNKPAELLQKQPVVVNIGLELFAKSLEEQGGQVVRVVWEPPAQGDPELIDILDELL
jgi:hypothetical protein